MPAGRCSVRALLAGRYDSALVYGEYAQQYPGRFRVDQQLGSPDDVWIVYSRERTSQGLIQACVDSPVVFLFRKIAGGRMMVFDTLFGLDSALQPQLQMLESAVVEQDGKHWRLTLRPGLRFHHGEPVLARDVVASLRRWGRGDIFGTALFAATDALEAENDRTVSFRLKKPFPQLPAALGRSRPLSRSSRQPT